MPQADDEKKALTTLDHNHEEGLQPAGKTLFPAPIAYAISSFAQSSSFTLRVCTAVGKYAINGARVSTLTGLEVSRATVETILAKAGRDVADKSASEMARAEAEGILQRSLGALHSTISSISFATSASFWIGHKALSDISSISQAGLSWLNAIGGSTESSRAIAAIITLISTELQRPERSGKGQSVGYGELLTGCIGFVLLQRWGWRKTEMELREREVEEVIWDVVVLDNGFRADVVGSQKDNYSNTVHEPGFHAAGRSIAQFPTAGDRHAMEVVGQGKGFPPQVISDISLPADAETRWNDEEIRDHIMDQLPEGVHATITTETVATKTITVDIFDAEMADVAPPPGTTMIEERLHHPSEQTQVQGAMDKVPQQRVVFQTGLKRTNSADIEPRASLLDMTPHYESHTQGFSEGVTIGQGQSQPSAVESDREATQSPSTMELDDPALDTVPGNLPIISPDRGQPSSLPANPADESQTSLRVANQKRARKPVSSVSTPSGSDTPKSTFSKSPFTKIAQRVKSTSNEKSERQQPKKKASKQIPTPRQSSGTVKDVAASPRPLQAKNDKLVKSSSPASGSTLTQPTAASRAKELPRPALPPRPDVETARSRLDPNSRPDSRTSYYSVHEQRRDSMVSQRDTYSIQSVERHPDSPTLPRTHLRTPPGLAKTRSGADIAHSISSDRPGSSSSRHHRRSRSFVPSVYSLATNDSETSLILAPRWPLRKSVYEDEDVIIGLNRDGRVPGIFPSNHFVHNIRRYARFSSASYGSNFLRIMGLTRAGANMTNSTALAEEIHHHEHMSFSNHTGLPPDTILVSSFADMAGGSNSAGQNESGHPLVHYVTLDHESKAVVLTCRGTLGFEDVLTDMTCDYDDLYWQGKPYQVHKGMHASATRLLEGAGMRIMAAIKATLEEFDDYGLVICGHSLAGGVGALLAILISEPSNAPGSGGSFVTASKPRLLASKASPAERTAPDPISLPPNRRIHVYAYGPPATLSPPLRLATRGLITTIVNGQDVVPSLSLGVLHDFQSVAQDFRDGDNTAITNPASPHQIPSLIFSAVKSSIGNALYVDAPPAGGEEDRWAWASLQALRAGMSSAKLVPPGEVFVVEQTRVLQRDYYSQRGGVSAVREDGSINLGRPASRVQLKLVKDVEARFGEVRFSGSMLTDHNPGRYEASLAALASGILGDD